MRLAVFADIHANLPALEAVLRDAGQRGVEGCVHLGDLVGFGPWPNEVVERIRSEEIPGVAGNQDLAVCHPDPAGGEAAFFPPQAPAVARQVYRWTRRQLCPELREFLATVPAQLQIQEGSLRVALAHASPADPLEGLGPDTPAQRLEELLDGCGADILLVGHTHRPWAHAVGERVVLNPGSVGRPLDGDPRAAYLVLDTTGGVTAEHVRVEFDVEKVTRERVRLGLPSG